MFYIENASLGMIRWKYHHDNTVRRTQTVDIGECTLTDYLTHFLSSNFILPLKHHWSCSIIDLCLPHAPSLLGYVLSQHTDQQELRQSLNQFKECSVVCFQTATPLKD